MSKDVFKNEKRTRALSCGRPSPAKTSTNPVTQHHEWKRKLDAYLSSKKLKNSEQRWKIAETILLSGGHLDAQTLVERVKHEHPRIGAATVYRTIKLLLEASILKESLIDSYGRAIYEVPEDPEDDNEHHDHIVCVDCGHIFEFHSDKIESLQNSIVGDMDFTPVRHRHVIYVKCKYKT